MWQHTLELGFVCPFMVIVDSLTLPIKEQQQNLIEMSQSFPWFCLLWNSSLNSNIVCKQQKKVIELSCHGYTALLTHPNLSLVILKL